MQRIHNVDNGPRLYRVERGPVSPPASQYGPARRYQTGDTVRLVPSSWTRAGLREGRLVEVTGEAEKPTKAGKSRRKGGNSSE